jgi:SSS family solute:Na+ symporter
VLGWIFAPFYLRAKIFTTPEFLERRYTPATRTFLSVIFLVSQVTAKASPEQLAGLTYRSVSREQNAEDRKSYGFREIFHTCVILTIIIGIYIYFW